jgi:YfiH family protein
MVQVTSNGVFPTTFRQLKFYRIQAFDHDPRLEHAVFTRKGGFSQTPYHSLNMSTSVGDHPRIVTKNIDHACRAVDISPERTVSCHLVHGSDVLVINKSNRRQVVGFADGMITRDHDIFLFMRFGDCTPLLLFDPVQGAVGLTHAGWRGTMQNVTRATIEKMVKQFQCRPKDIIAAIGPSIGPCCYEVGQDVDRAAEAAFADPDGLFVRRNGRSKRRHFNMWEANRRQLAESGVEHIIQSTLCTACRTDEFFSHRAEMGLTGRFGVIIGLRGEIG